MTLNVSLKSIRNDFTLTYNKFASEMSQWAGYTVSIIKSGLESAKPYVQDKRVAVVSLIGVNLLLVGCANLCSSLINRLPQNTVFGECCVDFLDFAMGISIIVGGVAAFSKYAQLPLSIPMITAISLATITVKTAINEGI